MAPFSAERNLLIRFLLTRGPAIHTKFPPLLFLAQESHLAGPGRVAIVSNDYVVFFAW